MTDIVLRDLEPLLADRIKRLGDARGWPVHETLRRVLEQGLPAFEHGAAMRLEDSEAGALKAAIAALEQVPSDPGFALIGRVAVPAVVPADEPEQTISGHLSPE